MDILAALKQEEAKLQKQADKVRQQLDAVRAARKILGREVVGSGKPIGKKKRVMSAAARAKIGKATKERWAKLEQRRRNVSSRTLRLSLRRRKGLTADAPLIFCGLADTTRFSCWRSFV
jgi:hypothetical protein